MSSAIGTKYNQLIAANPWIGKPVTDEQACPDKVGYYRHYDGGASIYWHPQTGAHLIYGLIRSKWAALGWEQSPLGYPITDEFNPGSNKGRFNNLQYGAIAWKQNASQAFAVYGSIYSKWAETKWDMGFLGFPLTDELGTPDGIGRFNHFEGGSIYFTPDTGAHIVRGAIRDAWAAQGWELSRLQYPVTDELVTEGTSNQGRDGRFEGGEIFWAPQAGAQVKYYQDVSTSISLNNLHAGKVDASQVYVKFWNDGRWEFHVHLHDSSISYGDKYAIGFVLEGDGHGSTIQGSLGAKFSGGATTNDKTAQGTDPWIEKFWHKVVRTRVIVNLHVSDDPLSALGSLASSLEKYAPALISLL